ncbi:histidine phosphatase superfamily [Aspergillus karnatakaensis]|uniref:uncharacterized protein n=1 Tax=Aspergillus karnatakaensis TaxID=1810916 RepID=UPI003CCDFB6A
MLSSIILLVLGLGSFPATAQDQTAQIWAVFAYTVRGERDVTSRPGGLTPHGANQLHDAGSAFRDRYVSLNAGLDGSSTRIENISPYLIDSEDVGVASTPEIAVLASAQAFMQGLYPPLDESFNSTFFSNDAEEADGSVTSGPLGGYQYPSIVTHGVEDPQSITIAGQALCPAHTLANIRYLSSKEFWQTYQDSSVFYNHLHAQALSGEYGTSDANYANATSISEFLEYQAVHNVSLLHSLSQEDLKRARWYAGNYVFATNGNTTGYGGSDDSIRNIAGQGIASSVLSAFETSVQQRGIEGKMTLKFGGYETAVSIFSLLGLASPQHSRFTSLPNMGASIVLELFSIGSESYPTYPDPSQLYVQFLLRNGTGAKFVPYPLFGYSPSKIAIPFNEFQAEMQKLSLGTTADWCRRCNSSAVFCSGVAKTAGNRADRVHEDHGRMSSAVAGVIGATVTIAVIALLALAFLAYNRYVKSQRKPSLGGFKGNSKMASDSDITFKKPQWEGSEVKPPAASARGYKRHGSWEMTDNASPPRLAERRMESSFAEEIEDEWQLTSNLQPTKVHEHV